MTDPSPVPSRRKIYLFKNKTVPHDPYHNQFLAAGFTPIFVPLLKHEFVDQSQLGSYLRSDEFEKSGAVIITSQRAIEALNWHLAELKRDENSTDNDNDKDQSALNKLLNKPVYTVGPACAAALKRWGYTDIRGGSLAGNGLKLAEIILEDINKEKELGNGQGLLESFVFFTGVTRRDIIPEKLTAAGVKIEERVVYRTLAVENLMQKVLAVIRDGSNGSDLGNGLGEDFEDEVEEYPSAGYENGLEDGMGQEYYVFFSPAEADPVVEAVRALSELRPVRLAAIGPTTETYLRDKKMTPHVVAPKPDATHLIQEILRDIETKSEEC